MDEEGAMPPDERAPTILRTENHKISIENELTMSMVIARHYRVQRCLGVLGDIMCSINEKLLVSVLECIPGLMFRLPS